MGQHPIFKPRNRPRPVFQALRRGRYLSTDQPGSYLARIGGGLIVTITAKPSRLIGVAERNGLISCATAPLTVDQLPPWGGNNLQAIRKLVTDAALADLTAPMRVSSVREILCRMHRAGIPSIEASIYYPGRSYKRHGWRHSILTAI